MKTYHINSEEKLIEYIRSTNVKKYIGLKYADDVVTSNNEQELIDNYYYPINVPFYEYLNDDTEFTNENIKTIIKTIYLQIDRFNYTTMND